MGLRAGFMTGAALAALPVAAGAQPGATTSATPLAQPPPAASASPTPTAPKTESVSGTCIERIPEGKQRPKLGQSFPSRGTSGHGATLTVVVEHLKGEEVLPGGFRIAESAALEALEQSQLVLPDPEGPAGPVITRSPDGTRTEVKITLVPLPAEPGRHELTLPPLPITLARASGQVVTVCTKPHSIVVEDPIANTPNPKPKPNPAARRQIEEWVLLKQLVYGGLLALLVGLLAAWAFSRWRRRPRPVPPPPPPRPPWEVAFEELHDVRHAGFIRSHRYSEHFDRVSDTIRKYLGDRFGYDGLESTTREALAILTEVSPAIPVLDQIRAFMRQADLVKFARLTPTEEECEQALARGEEIVRSTMPVPEADAPPMPTARGAS